MEMTPPHSIELYTAAVDAVGSSSLDRNPSGHVHIIVDLCSDLLAFAYLGMEWNEHALCVRARAYANPNDKTTF